MRIRLLAIGAAIALLAGIAGPVGSAAAYSESEVAQGLCQLQRLPGSPSTPALSVGPEVGWNAGLTSLTPPAASYMRLWDMNVAWKDINPAQGVFDFSVLDRRIAQVNGWGARPVLVLGLTPTWASTNPSAGNGIWGAGSAYPPTSMDAWRAYVQAVVSRYGSQIAAYEVWNEANLPTFWAGTPQQMAEMTTIASQVIGSTAQVIAPSVTTRLASGAKFMGPFVAALSSGPDTIDTWAIHSYPAGGAGGVDAAAAARRADIVRWQTALVEAVGPGSPWLSKAVWDTEVNFGLRGPGSSPKTDFSDADGARLLQLAYSDSQELGIDQTFWYEFTAAPYDLLGVQMTPQTPAILAAWGGLPGYLAQQLPAQRAASICAPTSGGSSAGQDTPATPVAQSIIARGERPDTRESRVVVTVSAQGYRAGTELIVFFRRPGDRWQESTRTVTLDAKGNGEWSRNSGRTLRVYVKDPSTGIRSETTVIPAMQ